MIIRFLTALLLAAAYCAGGYCGENKTAPVDLTITSGITGKEIFADGVGAKVRFLAPEGIAIHGNYLFVTDGNSVRKVVISTGEVSTLAGLPDARGSDDGIGRAARFAGPSGIAADGRYLYVADTANQVIRKVDAATGVVTTIVGTIGQFNSADGVGSLARIDRPTAIATDGENLYVDDSFINLSIRKIVAATGETTTFATAPEVRRAFTSCVYVPPNGVATDGRYVYIGDTSDRLIRKVSTSTGEITSVTSNTGQSSLNLPSGITVDKGYLYVADAGDHVIRRVRISSGEIAVIAGKSAEPGFADGIGALARFDKPSGIVTDGTSLYVVDSGSRSIRRVVISTGEVTTIAGEAPKRTGAK